MSAGIRLPLRLLGQAAALVAEEYGDGYVDRRVYHPLHLLWAVLSGRLILFGIPHTGGLAGVIAIRKTPLLSGAAELSMQVVKKSFRRQGIGGTLVAVAVRYALQTNASCCYGHCVTNHCFSQAELERCGFIPCGLLFSRYDERRLYPEKPDAGRHMLAVLARAVRCDAPLVLHPPKALARAVGQYYASSSVAVFCGEDKRVYPRCRTRLRVKNDPAHRSCELFIMAAGDDFAARLPKLLRNKPHERDWVFTVYLNLLHPTCAYAYRILLQYGFFFAGFHPHCKDAEYLLLHAQAQEIDFSSLCTTPSVGALLEAIKPYYAARQQEGFSSLWWKGGAE